MPRMTRHVLITACVLGLACGLVASDARAASPEFIEERDDGVTIVRLTQTPCVFLESEEAPQAYTSTKKADCEAINAQTLADRTLRPLRLKPGRHIFRVENRNVPYELGFWLRGQGVGRLTLPTVSGGGLMTGTTRDYEITLVEGRYYYSCPLNPTPDYTLVVE